MAPQDHDHPDNHRVRRGRGSRAVWRGLRVMLRVRGGQPRSALPMPGACRGVGDSGDLSLPPTAAVFPERAGSSLPGTGERRGNPGQQQGQLRLSPQLAWPHCVDSCVGGGGLSGKRWKSSYVHSGKHIPVSTVKFTGILKTDFVDLSRSPAPSHDHCTLGWLQRFKFALDCVSALLREEKKNS